MGGEPGWGASRPGPCLSRCPFDHEQNVKQLYALVCETQRYSSVLDAVIASAGLLRAEKKLRPHLAKVAGPGVGGTGLGAPLRTWSPPSEPGRSADGPRCDFGKSPL